METCYLYFITASDECQTMEIINQDITTTKYTGETPLLWFSIFLYSDCETLFATVIKYDMTSSLMYCIHND